MERRSFILNSILASSAAVMIPKLSFAAESMDSSHPVSYKNPALLEKIAAVQKTIQDCEKKGKICEKHCDDRLAAGDTMFEKCKFNVQQMQIMCEATGKLASLNSPLLGQTLDSCISALKSCREACLEHKAHFAHGMHLECKNCAEACENCLNACNDLKSTLPKSA